MEKTIVCDFTELLKSEAVAINGGGSGFNFLGKIIGLFGDLANSALENGYERSGPLW